MTGDIQAAFADGAAFIPYLAAGDAGPADHSVSTEEAISITRRYVRALIDGGADIIELGLPFSEPIADGPTVRRATSRALENGMTPDRFFELTRSLQTDTPIVVMTYYNLIYQYGEEQGVDAFVEGAAAAGISGIIVPDLPVEESSALLAACERNDVALIFIVAPTTRADRLKAITEIGTGYLYVQARLGTTGAQTDVSDATTTSLERIQSFEKQSTGQSLPKAVGFGISTADHARTIIASGADGIIVGSALIDLLSGDAVDQSAQLLASKAANLKEGALAGVADRNIGPERT